MSHFFGIYLSVFSFGSFHLNQGNTTALHAIGSKLRLEGQIDFSSSASDTAAIKVVGAEVSSVQMTNANIHLSDSVNASLAGECQSANTSVQFSQADPVSVLQIKSDSKIDWRSTRFEGSGAVTIAKDVTLAEVSLTQIGEGIELSFDDITATAVHKWRNNTWPNQKVNLTHAAAGGVYMCNLQTAGEKSGCDHRAKCHNKSLGGVGCRHE